MTNFYTSDWHLQHENLVKSGFREASEAAEIDKRILDNINRKVKKEDRLYVLGDITMCNSKRIENAIAFIDKIECDNIYIIEGNHDEVKLLTKLIIHPKVKRVQPWMTIIDYAFGLEDRLFLSHHPVLDYHGGYPQPVANLHGHCHGTVQMTLPFNFDVGVDCHNFEPMTWEELLSKRFGDHANPRRGYYEYARKFSRLYYNFANINHLNR